MADTPTERMRALIRHAIDQLGSEDDPDLTASGILLTLGSNPDLLAAFAIETKAFEHVGAVAARREAFVPNEGLRYAGPVYRPPLRNGWVA